MDPRLTPDTDTPDSLGELLPKQSTFTNSPNFTSNAQEINFITPETENINETLRTYYHPNQPFSAPLGENKSAGPVIGIYFPLQGNPSVSAPLLLNTPNSPFRPVRRNFAMSRYCLIFWCIFTFVILCVFIATLAKL